jgi:hypothetical protein
LLSISESTAAKLLAAEKVWLLIYKSAEAQFWQMIFESAAT